MFAVVLVGGFGTRLRPLTNHVPKPMLPIGNVPMVVRLAERLAAGGVTDIVLALGFQPDAFRSAFLGDSLTHGDTTVKLHYAVEPEPRDTAGAIKFAADAVGIDGTFVVANGDIVTGLAISDLIRAHREGGCEATIHLTPVDDPSSFGVVELDDSHIVKRFVEKPAAGETSSNLINAGTYVMEASVLDRIAADVPVSVERVTFPDLVAAGELKGYPTNDSWIDTGRPEFYLEANLAYTDSDGAIVESEVASTARVSDVIANRAVIGENADVSRSVLLPGAVIEASSRVENSLVWGRVSTGASIIDAVIGQDGVVPPGEHRGIRLPEPPQ
jgi:mannose-1-phosphate guanylyltransferase